jgi:hypothetical protein
LPDQSFSIPRTHLPKVATLHEWDIGRKAIVEGLNLLATSESGAIDISIRINRQPVSENVSDQRPFKPPSASSKQLLPWLVAVAFFMESLDTTPA